MAGQLWPIKEKFSHWVDPPEYPYDFPEPLKIILTYYDIELRSDTQFPADTQLGEDDGDYEYDEDDIVMFFSRPKPLLYTLNTSHIPILRRTFVRFICDNKKAEKTISFWHRLIFKFGFKNKNISAQLKKFNRVELPYVVNDYTPVKWFLTISTIRNCIPNAVFTAVHYQPGKKSQWQFLKVSYKGESYFLHHNHWTKPIKTYPGG